MFWSFEGVFLWVPRSTSSQENTGSRMGIRVLKEINQLIFQVLLGF